MKSIRKEIPMNESQPYIIVVNKKVRSKRPRRVRSNFSPVLKKNEEGIQLSIDSSCFSYLNHSKEEVEVSCDSSIVSVQSNNITSKAKKKANNNNNNNKRQFTEIENAPFRRITRAYSKLLNESQTFGVSESSCCVVESNSAAVVSNFKNANNETEISEITSEVVNVPVLKDAETDVVSLTIASGVVVDDSCSVLNEGRGGATSLHLNCTEKFSTCYDNENDNDDVVSMHSELHFSDFDFSEYSSLFDSSGTKFSEKSSDDDSPPSVTYTLLHEFRVLFRRSTQKRNAAASAASLRFEEGDYHSNNLSDVVRFEEDDEECYAMLRSRERRQVMVYDYVEEYRTTTEYGDLIVDQRSQMVHWIIDRCQAKEYQHETVFLAVALLDRFLSKGYFKTQRNLHILGIACLALATRIEENQPYNSVRQKNFYVGNNIYTRSEVVAMEWLVQEVLNFQCFLPTIYNFLWFYLKAASADAEMEKRIKYLAMLVLSDPEHLCFWPSTVAASLVILAALGKNQGTIYHRIIQIHARTKHDDLPDSIKSLHWLLQFVN